VVTLGVGAGPLGVAEVPHKTLMLDKAQASV